MALSPITTLPPELRLRIGEYVSDGDLDSLTKVSKTWRVMLSRKLFRRVYFDNTQRHLGLQLREFLMGKGDPDKDRLRQCVVVATIIIRCDQQPDWTSFSTPARTYEALPSLITDALTSMTSLSVLKLQVDNFTDEQTQELIYILPQTNVLSGLCQLRIAGPVTLVPAIVGGCNPDKLKALHIQGWIDSPEYTAARKHEGLERLHLHYDKPDAKRGASLLQDTTLIYGDFTNLKWLVLSEEDFGEPETDDTVLRHDDHLTWVITRTINALKSTSTLERLALSLRHDIFNLDVVRRDWSFLYTPLRPHEITAWYEEIVGCVMDEVPSLQEFWVMDQYPFSYSGIRSSDGEVIFARHTSSPAGSLIDLLD
ncbi:hypothetical protein FDECE_4928 [Fusarium decemcellulare]|nr:hypothetical protein FDECE_4928 [Fusarium decemcellulare]